jgi:hypothetical protein
MHLSGRRDIMSRVFTAGLGLALVMSTALAGAAGAGLAAADGSKAAPSVVGRGCMTTAQEPCSTARQYKRAFTRGDLGRTPFSKSKFTAAFKTKLRKAVVKQGLIPPPHARSGTAARGSYKYDDWGDYWDAFNNTLDCVAPGAESSCKKDFDKIKPLKDPAKVVVGCGGLAVVAFYTAGSAVPATVAITGGLTCSWGMAISAW